VPTTTHSFIIIIIFPNFCSFYFWAFCDVAKVAIIPSIGSFIIIIIFPIFCSFYFWAFCDVAKVAIIPSIGRC
jgi:hypothetical protein